MLLPSTLENIVIICKIGRNLIKINHSLEIRTQNYHHKRPVFKKRYESNSLNWDVVFQIESDTYMLFILKIIRLSHIVGRTEYEQNKTLIICFEGRDHRCFLYISCQHYVIWHGRKMSILRMLRNISQQLVRLTV